ncbi:peptidylprolyl isomerase [Bacteroidetes bacterium endosymbiont of Geopemphigus sp.]|uniref:peptidylprolyl isomerase n=1 Tax=Bacteroidetes bacterium endosymbiont of Geopemphigus sp. TaxID=2047937 RepID=UPI000CD1E676|nr:peptidylprolyl isomerase [Bacteroidetes bacterium endosymbiont of Geopemphigus sp.]
MCQLFRTSHVVFILFSFSISPCSYAQEKLERIAAVVGDEIILESEIQEGISNNRAREKTTPEDPCKFFEEMLSNRMLLYYAKKDTDLRVNDQQVQSGVEEIVKGLERQAGGKEGLLKTYERSTLGEIREEIGTLIKNRQYIQGQYESITKDINASPQQVRNFYEKNKDRLTEIPEQFEPAQIVFFPRLTHVHRGEIINQLKKMKEDILQGESFATKAIANSEDPGSAIDAGLIKNIKRGQMIKEFEVVAFSIEEGEISEPFETEFGFHILQLEKRKEQEVDVRHILLRPKYTDEEIKTAKALADSVYTLLAEKKISFEEAVKKYSAEKSEKTNDSRMKNPETGVDRFEKSQLPLNTAVYIANLQEGELSKPYEEEYDGHKVYVILKLIKHIPAHKVSFLQDYQQLKRMTESSQKREKLSSWIRKRIDDVFIRIGKDYQACSFENNWLKK